MKKTNYTKTVKGFSFLQLSKSILLALIFGAVSLVGLRAQTSVFLDDFNRSALTGGSPTMTYGSWSSASGIITVSNASAPNVLSMYTNSTAGRTYVHGQTSGYLSFFNTSLTDNLGNVTWEMSMRTNRSTALSGFTGASTYGIATVLAATSNDFHTANGYAVIIRKGTTTNSARLVKFAGGLDDEANFTQIGTSSAEFTANGNYSSIKIVFDPSNDSWSFYFRNDASSYTNPTTGTLTQVGTSTIESTYTSTAMTHFGYYWNHGGTSTPTNNQGKFFYYKVSVNVPVTFTSGWPKAENPTPTGFTAKTNTNVAGTTYFVVVPSGAAAPTSAQVVARKDASDAAAIASGSIACAVGSTEYSSAAGGTLANATTYDVYFVAQDASAANLQASPVKVSVTTTGSASAPLIQDPTATTITNNSATLGGNITSDGGSSITERGTVWNTTTGVTIADNLLAEGGTTAGIFSQSRSSLPAKTQIFYKAYATNAINTTLSTESSFYTLADEPTAQVTGFTATASSFTSIDLTWTAADCDGYLILKRQSSNATSGVPVDGVKGEIGSAMGSGYIAAYVSSGATTTQTISDLTPGLIYTFKIFSVNSNGVNAETYNYFTTSAPTASATTTLPASTTYTWNQTGTASWTTATNWTPTRTTPYSNDKLQINGGGSIVLTDVPTQTIAQLSISNNTTVELQSATASTLTIAGEAGTDLTVSAGSSLNINQVNAIVIALLTGTTAEIAGTMAYAGGAHKLTAVDAGTVAFKTGATFTAGTAFSGNAFGTTGNSSIVFESGSSYIFIAGSNPFGATAPASAIVFQAGSNYIHKSTGSPSFSNRTYANFELNEATAIIVSTSANPVTMDNLILTSGSLSLGVTAAFNVKGDISVASGSTLNLNPSTAGTLVFSGTNPQTITNNGILTNNAFSIMSVTNSNPVVFANSFGATLTAAASLPGVLNNSGTFNLSEASTTLSGTINQVVKDASWSAVITAASGATIDINALTMNVTLASGYSPVKDDVAILINIPSGTVTGDFVSLSLPSSLWTKYSSAGMISAKFDNTTSVSNLQTDPSVYVVNGQLIMSEGDVYNSVGMRVASVKSGSEKTAVSLRPGIYIVKSNYGSKKVVVK